jgi:hypothetical protein
MRLLHQQMTIRIVQGSFLCNIMQRYACRPSTFYFISSCIVCMFNRVQLGKTATLFTTEGARLGMQHQMRDWTSSSSLYQKITNEIDGNRPSHSSKSWEALIPQYRTFGCGWQWLWERVLALSRIISPIVTSSYLPLGSVWFDQVGVQRMTVSAQYDGKCSSNISRYQ